MALRFGGQAYPAGGLRFGAQDYQPLDAAVGSGVTASASAPAGAATGAARTGIITIWNPVYRTISAPAGSATSAVAIGTGVTATASAPAGIAYLPTVATGPGVTVTVSAPDGVSGLRFGGQVHPFGGLRFGRAQFQPLIPYIGGIGAGAIATVSTPAGGAIGYNRVVFQPPFDLGVGSLLASFRFDSTTGGPKAGDSFQWPNGIGVTIYPDGHGTSLSNSLIFTGIYNDGTGDFPIQVILDDSAQAFGDAAAATTLAPIGTARGPSTGAGTGATATTSAPTGAARAGVVATAPIAIAMASAPTGSVSGFRPAVGAGATATVTAPLGNAQTQVITPASGAGSTATTAAPAGSNVVPANVSGAGAVVLAFPPNGFPRVSAAAAGSGSTATAAAPDATAHAATAGLATGAGVIAQASAPDATGTGAALAQDLRPLAPVIPFPPDGGATGNRGRRFRGPRIDVTEVFTDPDFASYDLVAERCLAQVVSARGQPENTIRLIEFIGVVTNDKGSKLQRRRDGTRVTDSICIHSKFLLTTGEGLAQDADVVRWQGNRWTVTQVTDWGHFGAGWHKATCELIPLAG